jgi:dihydrofolate synthase/folylpolyglutamate synthase
MPERFSTTLDAERYLLRYSPEKKPGEAYNLERMILLMERLGNPQDDIPAIHVAGTSGKTSTANYIRNVLQASGKRTGLTTSPHISSITERVQVDGQPLEDEAFLRYLEAFFDLIGEWQDIAPTYFELLTAFAFWVFKRSKVDYMVIEVGLGGLLDATNVIHSSKKVSVITPIGLDHTEILGDTEAEIAVQKAGIVLPDSDVFSSLQVAPALDAIETVATRKHARLQVIDATVDTRSEVPLFQQPNFALACRVVEFIATRDGFSLADPARIRTLVELTPPGRFEVYEVEGKTVILDGAHNPQKLAAFNRSLRHRYDGPFAWLVGFISAPDDKIDACIREIGHPDDDFIVTGFSVGQDIKGRASVDAEVLQRKFKEASVEAASIANAQAALDELLKSKQRTVVVTGSLYLVAQLRRSVAERAT